MRRIINARDRDGGWTAWRMKRLVMIGGVARYVGQSYLYNHAMIEDAAIYARAMVAKGLRRARAELAIMVERETAAKAKREQVKVIFGWFGVAPPSDEK